MNNNINKKVKKVKKTKKAAATSHVLFYTSLLLYLPLAAYYIYQHPQKHLNFFYKLRKNREIPIAIILSMIPMLYILSMNSGPDVPLRDKNPVYKKVYRLKYAAVLAVTTLIISFFSRIGASFVAPVFLVFIVNYYLAPL